MFSYRQGPKTESIIGRESEFEETLKAKESVYIDGELGGKICGAGGGGFLLLYCPVEQQSRVRKALRNLRELPFRFEEEGTKAIFNVREG